MNAPTDRPRTLLSMAPSVYLPAMVFEIGNGAVTPVIAITALDLGASAGTAGLLVAGDGRRGRRGHGGDAGLPAPPVAAGVRPVPVRHGRLHRDVLPGPPVLPHR